MPLANFLGISFTFQPDRPTGTAWQPTTIIAHFQYEVINPTGGPIEVSYSVSLIDSTHSSGTPATDGGSYWYQPGRTTQEFYLPLLAKYSPGDVTFTAAFSMSPVGYPENEGFKDKSGTTKYHIADNFSFYIAGRSKSQFHLSGRKQPIHKRMGADAEAIYDPLTRSYLPVADLTQTEATIKHQPTRGEVSALTRHQEYARRRENFLSELRAPPPGGFGGGVAFKSGTLLFQSATAVYYYLVIAPSLGEGQTSDLLYMTSSNRASKGCEALISFAKERQYKALFQIWDWATPEDPNNGHFIFALDYSQLASYRIPMQIPTDSGGSLLEFEALYIINSTERIEGNIWENRVYLHNHDTGARDLR
jgi:hypothetical protein